LLDFTPTKLTNGQKENRWPCLKYSFSHGYGKSLPVLRALV
jgi:hypothetical protein